MIVNSPSATQSRARTNKKLHLPQVTQGLTPSQTLSRED
jgi:hypothetical protein